VVALGKRRRGLDYAPQDRESLQHTANLVARAINPE
jgi:hypothetical protein